ncbi:hypothetical protein [Streptomyces sp. OE57]|uniref:hypothetical protein n=1 Tax=Streptomyces lacaronensis TaxID=3379885 RepID=UPI0039B72931
MVGQQGGRVVQRAGGVAVAVRVAAFGGSGGDGEQLRDAGEDSVVWVVFAVKLAQDLGELLGG